MNTDLASKNAITKLFNSPAYALLDKIGEGGFGSVYRAKQTSTGQIVAIKFLTISPEFDAAKKQRYIERFERETQLGSRLQHPNIVHLLDKGCSDDLLYAVFEYVDGQTLKQRLAEGGALLPVEAAQVMGQVLDALAHAHGQGVLHRDIKPANIMLTKTGVKTHAKVLDFGIGTMVDEARQLEFKTITLTQETLGTPSYSAPEQLRGEPPTLQTDLYVWGLLFIECLTGQRAISGSSLASVFHKQLSQSDIPLPAAIIGHPVGALLRRVLQKKVYERNVKAADLYQELAKINFSNLVGQLSSAEHNTSPAVTTKPDELLETQTDYNAQSFTGLTERKQITALSICLNVQSIAEDTVDHEVINALYRDQKNQCVDVAVRYGAWHVGTLSDTLLFYFGYPMVSDNDIRLCARTALDIVSNLHKRNALLRTNQDMEFDIHIGMHTGLVTCYADATPEGDTANIAMKLARMAAKNQILCSDHSRKMLESHIEFQPTQSSALGVEAIKTPLFSLTAERQLEAFGFLRCTQKNSAFIGRDKEMTQLTTLLNASEITSPKLAHVFGEAGIGKSRLVYELRNTAQKMSHYIAQCLPEHQHNALYPILNILKYQYSLDALTPSEAFERLSQAIQLLDLNKSSNQTNENDRTQGLVILCTWLNLPLGRGFESCGLLPELQKKLLFSTLSDLLTHQRESLGCDSKGVTIYQRNLFIFEDMHWADPTSLEFIGQFSASLQSTNDVFISTSRQPIPVSLNKSGFESINVKKLTNAATSEFIVTLFDNKAISTNLLDILISRTDGIPLFIEELIDMLKQNKLVRKLNNIIDFTSPDKLDEVPNSLRDSLQQKLDSLIYAKETAQLAATIGRGFDYNLLVAASHRSEDQVQNDLNELIDAEVIYQQRKVDGDSYLFKHALVRDAAYEGMDKLNRIKSHEIIALRLETLNLGELDSISDILSEHFLAGQCYQQSACYAKRSAELAMDKGLYQQVMHFSNKTIFSHQYIDGYIEEKLEINQLLTTATMMLSGWASPAVDKLISNSKQLLSQLGDSAITLKASVYWALATHNNVIGNHKEVYEIITSSLKINGLDEGVMAALYALKAHSLWCQGALYDALGCIDKALAIYDEKKHADHAAKFGHDTKIFALSLKALIFAGFGQSEKAKSTMAASFSYAEKLKSSHSFCMAKFYWCCCLYLLNDLDDLEGVINEILDECKKYNLANWVGSTAIMQSLVNLDIAKAQYGLDMLLNQGATLMQGFWNAIIADAEIKLKRYPAALTRLNKSIIQSIDVGDFLFEIIQLRVKSRLLILMGENELAHEISQAATAKFEKININLAISLSNTESIDKKQKKGKQNV